MVIKNLDLDPGGGSPKSIDTDPEICEYGYKTLPSSNVCLFLCFRGIPLEPKVGGEQLARSMVLGHYNISGISLLYRHHCFTI
jgi:hypothetical protein